MKKTATSIWISPPPPRVQTPPRDCQSHKRAHATRGRSRPRFYQISKSRSAQCGHRAERPPLVFQNLPRVFLKSSSRFWRIPPEFSKCSWVFKIPSGFQIQVGICVENTLGFEEINHGFSKIPLGFLKFYKTHGSFQIPDGYFQKSVGGSKSNGDFA